MTFIPTNEQGVVYLFSRLHEALGFEKVVSITTRTPDCIALRNGIEQEIEFEYKSSGLNTHKLVKTFQKNESSYKVDESGDIIFTTKDSGGTRTEPFQECEVKENPYQYFVYQRLPCDIVVCWVKDKDIKGVEVIELKPLIDHQMKMLGDLLVP